MPDRLTMVRFTKPLMGVCADCHEVITGDTVADVVCKWVAHPCGPVYRTPPAHHPRQVGRVLMAVGGGRRRRRDRAHRARLYTLWAAIVVVAALLLLRWI